MSTILENLRMINMIEESGKVEFSNYGAISNISKKFNEINKERELSGGQDTLIKAMRDKNFARAKKEIGFGNDLVQSDISREYINKYKAAAYGDAPAAGSSSLLEALRKKNMDETTGKM